MRFKCIHARKQRNLMTDEEVSGELTNKRVRRSSAASLVTKAIAAACAFLLLFSRLPAAVSAAEITEEHLSMRSTRSIPDMKKRSLRLLKSIQSPIKAMKLSEATVKIGCLDYWRENIPH
uniref:Uncharacterized protein n=1 Tax=Ditylum brightwellii TaxID=49249 RepID=A0A6V2C3M6_9STRA